MLHLYDDQWATYEPDRAGGYTSRLVTRDEKTDPAFDVMPRYWVPEHEVERRLGTWKEPWLLGWRDICRSTDERTLIGLGLSRVGVPGECLLALPAAATQTTFPAIWQCITSSFALDFVARQKVGGTHLKFFTMRQLPMPSAEDLSALARRSAVDLPGAVAQARDPACRDPAPRATLDALALHAFGLSRAECEHVLDAFPLVHRKDVAEFGEFRTKRLILDAYDELATVIADADQAPT